VTTKKQAQNPVGSDLEAFLNTIAEKYKINDEVLASRTGTAVERHLITSSTQRFSSPLPLLMNQIQDLILEGYRYEMSAPQAAYLIGNTGNISIVLRKPESLIEKELVDLKGQVEKEYTGELTRAMESEIETLMQSAAIESQQKAMDTAIKEQEAIKQRLTNILLQGVEHAKH